MAVTKIASLITALENVHTTDDHDRSPKERIQGYVRTVRKQSELPEIKYSEPQQSSCFKMAIGKICQGLNICTSMRCCGHETYYVSVLSDNSDCLELRRKTRRDHPNHQMTNVAFFTELYQAYDERLPLIFSKAVGCMTSRADREFWEEWDPVSEDPLDSHRVEILKNLMKRVDEVMVDVRLQKLKEDLEKTESSSQGLSRAASVEAIMPSSMVLSPADMITPISNSSSSSDTSGEVYATPEGSSEGSPVKSVHDSPTTSQIPESDITAETSLKKQVRDGNDCIDFDEEILRKDLHDILSCNEETIGEIIRDVVTKTGLVCTRDEIWRAVKKAVKEKQVQLSEISRPSYLASYTGKSGRDISVDELKQLMEQQKHDVTRRRGASDAPLPIQRPSIVRRKRGVSS